MQGARALRVVAAVVVALVVTAGGLTVHVVPHSHCDVGYVKTYEEYFTTEVQHILDTVTATLSADASLRFIWVETAYLQMWWEARNATTRGQFKALVAGGQIEIVSGGIVMNDEAVAHYDPVINQMTEGHRFVAETLGVVPRFGWQIDPFGASSVTPYLWALAGFDAHVIRRIDWQVALELKAEAQLEFLWRGVACAATAPAANASTIYTHILALTYSCPHGFNFQHPDAKPATPENLPFLADELYANVLLRRDWFVDSGHLLIPAGGDFMYQNATVQFSNMTRVLAYMNENSAAYGGFTFRFSTVGEYFAAVHDSLSASRTVVDTTVGGDFLPYNELPDTSWTGFYTSRPSLKAFSRAQDANLRLAEMLYVLAWREAGNSAAYADIATGRWAQSVLQHHDAITGTARLDVVGDYKYHLAMATAAGHRVSAGALAALRLAANVTASPAHIAVPAGGAALATTRVVACNSLGWPRAEMVSVDLTKVYEPTLAFSVAAADAPDTPVAVQINGPLAAAGLGHTLWFEAQVPAAGCAAYVLTVSTAKAGAASPVVAYTAASGTVVMDNGVVGLKVSATEGVVGMRSADRDGGAWMDVRSVFVEYASTLGSAYVFRGGAESELAGPVGTWVASGPLVDAAVAAYAWHGGATASWRVFHPPSGEWAEAHRVDASLAVGPVDAVGDGTNVALRFESEWGTDFAFYTDDSGFQFERREAGSVDGDAPEYSYWPAVSAARMDDVGGSGSFAIVVPYTHGAGMLGDGALEVMVHRRLLQNGWPPAGLGQALNETTRVTPTLALVLTNSTAGGAALLTARRYRNNYPVALSYGTSGGGDVAAVSALAAPLPPQVHLLTLKPWSGTEAADVMLRLARLDECGVDGNRVCVALGAAFNRSLGLAAFDERTLTMVERVGVERWAWPGVSDAHGGASQDECVELTPLQIRSFVASS